MRPVLPAVTALLSMTSLVACASFTDDVELICDVQAHAGTASSVDAYLMFVAEHAKTDEGRALGRTLSEASADPDGTQSALDAATQKADVADCKAAARFRESAEKRQTDEEIDSLCGKPRGELLDILRGDMSWDQRAALRERFYNGQLMSSAAKKLWAIAEDEKRTVDARADAIATTAKEMGREIPTCSYLDDVRRANEVESNSLMRQASARERIGGAPDLEAAKHLLANACSLGNDEACRRKTALRERITSRAAE